MRVNNIEHTILRNALMKFREETGLLAMETTDEIAIIVEKHIDTALVIKNEEDGQEIHCYAEIKRNITKATLGTIIFQIKTINNGVLITEYVNPALALELKNKSVQFIDTCGNAFINTFPFFVYIRGNKQKDNQNKYTGGQRAFNAPGLKIIYACLCNPGLENDPVREIARVADVGLGTVTATFKNLKEFGMLADRGTRGRNLMNKEKLLDRWLTGYQEVLRSKQIIGRYTTLNNKNWWENAILPEGFYWGGEVAAAKTTQYLKPEIITIYTHETLGELLAQNKLRRDPKGEIEILKAFWKRDAERDNLKTVHPLLIYADLIATGEDRNLEAAKIIREDEIDRLIREN